jgi:phage terminase small subunit
VSNLFLLWTAGISIFCVGESIVLSKDREPTLRQQKFIEEVLKHGNATEAARVAGYEHPNKQGPRLLVNVGIQERIQERIEDAKVQTNEVIGTLASHMRADLADILTDNEVLQQAKEVGLSHLIKKMKTTERFTKGGERIVTHEFEMYSAQEAAKQLCAVFGLNKLPAANPNEAAREALRAVLSETGLPEDKARQIVAARFGIPEEELVSVAGVM